MGQLMVNFKLCVFKLRRSAPNGALSHKCFKAGADQETLLQKQNCIQEAKTVFKTFFAIMRNAGFLSSTYVRCRPKRGSI